MTARLLVKGRLMSGWKRVQVARSLETLAGKFTVAVSDRDPASMSRIDIAPGDDCVVTIMGETVISGFIDAIRVSYDRGSHEVEIVGRDAAGDLVDCSAAIEPGEWLDTGLQDIASALCEPFGVSVNVTGDEGSDFRKFRIETGETVFEALDRLCRMRGLLAWSDGQGGIEIGNPQRSQAGVALRFGENILRATGEANWSDRYSDYTIYGQQAGSDDIDGETAAHVTAEASDGSVKRARPLIVVAEQGVDDAEAQMRVDWEASVRAARARQIEITVQGWREMGDRGSLWDFGREVNVRDDWLGFNGSLLIASVTFDLSEQGTTTRLMLVPAAAFQPQLEETSESDSAVLNKEGGSNWWL